MSLLPTKVLEQTNAEASPLADGMPISFLSAGTKEGTWGNMGGVVRWLLQRDSQPGLDVQEICELLS